MKKKFLFHSYSLAMTGGSKSILHLANSLIERGHSVDIILESSKVEYSVKDNIDVYVIGSQGVKKLDLSQDRAQNVKISKDISSNIKSVKSNFLDKYSKIRESVIWIRYIYRLIKFPFKLYQVRRFLDTNHYDLVVSNNMYNDLEHIFYYRKLKTCLSLRNSPVDIYSNRICPTLFSKDKYFEGVTCIGVSNSTTKEMKDYVDESKTSLITIYNPFDIELIRQRSNEEISELNCENFFVVVGSLGKRKRVDLSIRSFAVAKIDSHKLVILGEGEEELNLKRLVRELEIEDRVLFLGAQNNPYKFMKNAKALIMTSESEGLPRVLIESLICETPVISTDCPTGPSEILVEDLTQYLVPMKGENDDEIVDNVAKCINKIMIETPRIPRESLNRFKPEIVAEQWEQLL